VTDLGVISAPAPEQGAGRQRPRWLGRELIFSLVLLGPALALATSMVFALGEEGDPVSPYLRIVLLADLGYFLILTAVIGLKIGQLVMARRRKSAGSRLHLRLTGVFATVALVPTVIVAVFATMTVNFGIESWFSEQVGSVVRNSLATAQAYEREHRGNIKGDILAMANDLNRAAATGIRGSQLNELVAQQALLRELPEAFVFSSQREILARGEFSYLFAFEPPTNDQLDRARAGEIVIMEDELNNEIRALIYLTNYFDAFLYVTRDVQGEVLQLLDETRDTVQLYERLERERDGILFDFALIYLGFALLVIMSAILLGLWFAERLAKPVGRLVGAAESIGAGNLDIRVKEPRGNDEISMLSQVFNRMAGQLKGQRDDLVSAKEESEIRRHFIEAVLSGVTAGVIGLDGEGRIDLVNEAAADMLGFEAASAIGKPVEEVAPAFVALIEAGRVARSGITRGAVHETSGSELREFLGRVAPKAPDAPDEGLVLTFDDITALASAQRMAAWGDVARRIAHEIKNPLTPIQLSADRMRRKFAGQMGENGPAFEQYLDMITRQTGDIRRMVDEFSRFARMPEPVKADEDLAVLLRDAVLLQQEGHGDITYDTELPDGPVLVHCDRGLIGQCLTNLLQNAADSIDGRRESADEAGGDAAPPGHIRIALTAGKRFYRVVISDNGAGLPKEGRDRLTDPYVTNRRKGTGLGLAIVKKIVEQHGGELVLGDAPVASGLDGAQVTLRLPKLAVKAQSSNPGSGSGSGQEPDSAADSETEFGAVKGETGRMERGKING
jgi:two-component system nitrogen regulation sensor histidine kinase NtrY